MPKSPCLVFIMGYMCGPYKELSAYFHLVQRHASLKGGVRSQDGALSPFFEGITPPKKMDPKKWRSYERHSMNPVNSLIYYVIFMYICIAEYYVFELASAWLVIYYEPFIEYCSPSSAHGYWRTFTCKGF
ncbi:hypothetical protein FRACYDRAFT_232581 [Fragilariopsis cylindrus CCMP1102]|uniref:Uncharacterized protein n=1 Tax=Fragilariopsis cylindrus CCMP1102 TaxID=635003 RepID=A0A1E7FX86_9STRA|nr:hypothetical protein FRACYDRAFT_232581 [Fragilariopsis cylindrus CCMP1102]|eukprot:OEU22423.1 hypothetical protein FRACYDRAFT_232581 [Fragilariopsis cylindrus CCMP1102]